MAEYQKRSISLLATRLEMNFSVGNDGITLFDSPNGGVLVV
jgi:hypothetical protein